MSVLAVAEALFAFGGMFDVKDYKNVEGYSDPSAGEALATLDRERRQDKRLERVQMQEDYEALCRLFREAAEVKGFAFPGAIWLQHEKSGVIFKNG